MEKMPQRALKYLVAKTGKYTLVHTYSYAYIRTYTRRKKHHAHTKQYTFQR